MILGVFIGRDLGGTCVEHLRLCQLPVLQMRIGGSGEHGSTRVRTSDQRLQDCQRLGRLTAAQVGLRQQPPGRQQARLELQGLAQVSLGLCE